MECIDSQCLEPDTSGQGNIFMVADHLTHFAQSFRMKDQKAPTVAKVLVEKFLIQNGVPQKSETLKADLLGSC